MRIDYHWLYGFKCTAFGNDKWKQEIADAQVVKMPYRCGIQNVGTTCWLPSIIVLLGGNRHIFFQTPDNDVDGSEVPYIEDARAFHTWVQLNHGC